MTQFTVYCLQFTVAQLFTVHYPLLTKTTGGRL